MVRFESPMYRVKEIKRKSRARYAQGIKVGDRVKFYIGGLGGGNYRGGNYATDVTLVHEGNVKATLTQGELNGNLLKIFVLEEI